MQRIYQSWKSVCREYQNVERQMMKFKIVHTQIIMALSRHIISFTVEDIQRIQSSQVLRIAKLKKEEHKQVLLTSYQSPLSPHRPLTISISSNQREVRTPITMVKLTLPKVFRVVWMAIRKRLIPTPMES